MYLYKFKKRFMMNVVDKSVKLVIYFFYATAEDRIQGTSNQLVLSIYGSKNQ